MKDSKAIFYKTGFKYTDLEKSQQALDFFALLLKGFDRQELEQNFSKDFYEKLYLEAKSISKKAIAPHSNAYYSSIFVFQKQGEFFVHAGANIDPQKKENLKNAKFRNCAEKQASLSALEADNLGNEFLKILVLFRLDNKSKKLNSQKLLPCKDCFEKYILDLQKNNGVMIIISEEMQADDFILGCALDKKISFADKFRFLFFYKEDMNNLNLEAQLGANVT
jgi:hypothetical protein